MFIDKIQHCRLEEDVPLQFILQTVVSYIATFQYSNTIVVWVYISGNNLYENEDIQAFRHANYIWFSVLSGYLTTKFTTVAYNSYKIS